MKAIIASLALAVSLPASGQDVPEDLLKKPVSFDGVDVTISEIFEIIGMNLKPAPNVVFKGDAGEEKVPRLRVKDVSLGSLFKVIETVADVEVELIDESTAVPAVSDDPFAGGGTVVKRLTSSGVIVVSSRKPPKKVQAGMMGAIIKPKPTVQAKPSKVVTEVISLAEMKIAQASVIDAIKLTWDAIDPNLKHEASIAFHEPSKLLIVSGPPEAIENAQKVVAAMLPSYRELLEAKEKAKATYYPRTPELNSPDKILKNIPEIRRLFKEPETTEVPGVRRPATSGSIQLVPAKRKPAVPATRNPVLREHPKAGDLIEVPADPVPRADFAPAPKPSLPGR